MSTPEKRSVIVERDFPHPPEKLWRALTQPHLIEEWLMKNDFVPVVGRSFNLKRTPQPNVDIVIDCKVLVVEPNETLAYTWNYSGGRAAFNLQSTVTFTLTPTRAGTHLRMEQTGFSSDQKQALGGATAAWRQFFTNLEHVLGRSD